ncbi:MAG TPA: response regulator [Pirellulales bacterium]|jgi:CheY-like chemotaxis protein/anti-sigma regulatory factor (Ser/Thr protein kinase)|nr:response regulator [Pirellulales bacterium]
MIAGCGSFSSLEGVRPEMNYLLVVDDSLLDRQLVKNLLERRFNHRIEYASTGWEALEQIESHLPLAVITDLQMPEMDGLELTQTVRRRFPSVPVILMTAFGSEAIAVEALMRGATDYVPKVKLAAELGRAVEGALSATASFGRDPRLQQCLRLEQTHFELDNDTNLIPPLVDHLLQTARDMTLVDDADRLRLSKALFEALTNAIYHGNLELSAEELTSTHSSPGASELVRQRLEQAPYRDRRLIVEATLSPHEGRFVVRDEGPGFDYRREPNLAADLPHIASNERRGLVLIKLFMDEVHFNERGNEITLVKYKK